MIGIGEFSRRSRLSAKALRRYDELGLLPPARVDPSTGYRWYADTQLAQARLVAELRQIGMRLAEIKAVLSLRDPARRDGIEGWWAGAEADFTARRELARFLIDRFDGKRSAMNTDEIRVRTVPARNVLTLVRHVHWAEYPPVAREFFAMFQGSDVPRLDDGPAGAPFVVFHGDVTEDSDGPVEWCRPVPASFTGDAFPGLVLRTEPAHEEAYLHLARDPAQTPPAQSLLVHETLLAWAFDQHRRPAGSVRQVFNRTGTAVAGPGFECDFAIPLSAASAPAAAVTEVTAVASVAAADDGCELYYEQRGAGPGLLLITGGGGDSAYYAAIADILASSYTVISYDRRGNSSSGRSADPMSVSQQADDALAVLTACGLSSATVFGNSGGATIALDLAARHPSAFPVVVVHEPPLPGLLADGSLLREYEEILAVLDAEGWRAAFTQFMTRMAGLSPEEAAFVADQSPNWEQMMAREIRSFIDYRPDFDAIRAGGSLVVLAAGTDSDPRSRPMAAAVAAALGVEVAAFPGGHTGPLDVPDPFAARLCEVLRDASLPAGGGG